MKFKYNNQIIETPNLEKKLKRMGLTLNDIEIIPEKQKIDEIKEKVNIQKLYYFKHPSEDTLHLSFYPTLDKMKEYFKENPKFYWDEETKTGLGKKWTWKYINALELYELDTKKTCKLL